MACKNFENIGIWHFYKSHSKIQNSLLFIFLHVTTRIKENANEAIRLLSEITT